MAERIVVVGATGQIGRPLCRELMRTGHAVSVFSRDPARARHLVPGAADYLEWSPGSRLTAEGCAHLAAAGAVVYRAGLDAVDTHRRRGGHHRRHAGAGYQFRFPALDPALRDIIDKEPGA
jgi:uncharacterized protein YbjT (DUF2867 family)